MALPVIPLLSLSALFSAAIEFFAKWFLKRSFALLATRILFFGIIITMFLAFVAIAFSAFNAAKVLSPPFLSMAFGLVPPSGLVMLSSWLTVIAAKRVYDYKERFYMEFSRAGVGGSRY
jgi:hypothetical protein